MEFSDICPSTLYKEKPPFKFIVPQLNEVEEGGYSMFEHATPLFGQDVPWD